jgi:hypothetical protein
MASLRLSFFNELLIVETPELKIISVCTFLQ